MPPTAPPPALPLRGRECIPLLFLALAACAKPTTTNPTFTEAELKQEQIAQANAVAHAPHYFNDKKNYGYKQIDALDTRLGPIAQRIQHAAIELCNALRPADPADQDNNCIYTVSFDPHIHELNAYANGHAVVIAPAMVDFLKDDNQLAFVLSHEMGHNVMRHIDKQEHNANYGMALGMIGDVVAGMNRVNSKGAFTKLGGQQAALSYSPEFEAEADYVGLYIMARAGYKIEGAPNVWRMMSQVYPDGIYVSSSHPNNAARTIAMERTVVEIRIKQRQGLPLIPNIRPQET